MLNFFHNLNIFPIVDIISSRQIETIAFGETLLQLLQALPTLDEEWVVVANGGIFWVVFHRLWKRILVCDQPVPKTGTLRLEWTLSLFSKLRLHCCVEVTLIDVMIAGDADEGLLPFIFQENDGT